MVDLLSRRAGSPDMGGRNRLPAVFGGAPEGQRTPLEWRLRALAGHCWKGLIHIDFPAVIVGAAGDHRLGAVGTGFCLHAWRCERKEGRDYGTSHQGELQVFSHKPSAWNYDADAETPPHPPTRNLTEKINQSV